MIRAGASKIPVSSNTPHILFFSNDADPFQFEAQFSNSGPSTSVTIPFVSIDGFVLNLLLDMHRSWRADFIFKQVDIRISEKVVAVLKFTNISDLPLTSI